MIKLVLNLYQALEIVPQRTMPMSWAPPTAQLAAREGLYPVAMGKIVLQSAGR
jgi:hypothetical protein